MNVFDWLSNIPLHDSAKPFPVIEVSFSKGSRKEFFRNGTHVIYEKGDDVAVEGVGGYDVGQVSLTGELVKLQLKKYGVTEASVTKRVLHMATEEEIKLASQQKEREPEILIRSRAVARSLNLDMKLCEVEIQADSKKGTFFYTADQRVDFRELIKVYANDFRLKVEMRQIGARQESAKVGGIGSCGRELCCSTWLNDFKSVNTTAARYQNLSINQTKLSGQCGRLKCCLNYELDTYLDALRVFPDGAESLQTVKGNAYLQKRDIFKNLMWYSYPDNSKQYPLSIERVKEIIRLNKSGEKAEELQPVELETRESKKGILPEAGFINDVGQMSLRSLEKNGKKKKQQQGRQQDRPAQGGAPKEGGQANAGNRQQQQPRNGGQPQKQGERPQRSNQNPNAAANPNAPAGEPRKQQSQQPRPAQPNNRPQQGQPRDGQPKEGQPTEGPQREGQPQRNNENRQQQGNRQGQQQQANRPPRQGGQGGGRPQGENAAPQAAGEPGAKPQQQQGGRPPRGDRQQGGDRERGRKPKPEGGDAPAPEA